jgi:hypothetical protein
LGSSILHAKESLNVMHNLMLEYSNRQHAYLLTISKIGILCLAKGIVEGAHKFADGDTNCIIHCW